MQCSPTPFLRFGFVLLASSLALAVWLAQVESLGLGALVLAALMLVVVAGLFEWLTQKLILEADRRSGSASRSLAKP